MRKFALPITIATILLATILIVLVAPEQNRTTVSELEPLQDNHSPPSTKASTSCAGQPQPTAPGIVLVHLRPDVAVRTDGSGVHTSDVSLDNVLESIGAHPISPPA
jgi:hypothetical protein